MTLDFPEGKTEIPQWPGTQTIDIRQYSFYINVVFRKIVSPEIVYDFYKPGNPNSCFYDFIPGNYYIIDAKEAFSIEIT
jgi:hypothetical protein